MKLVHVILQLETFNFLSVDKTIKFKACPINKAPFISKVSKY